MKSHTRFIVFVISICALSGVLMAVHAFGASDSVRGLRGTVMAADAARPAADVWVIQLWVGTSTTGHSRCDSLDVAKTDANGLYVLKNRPRSIFGAETNDNPWVYKPGYAQIQTRNMTKEMLVALQGPNHVMDPRNIVFFTESFRPPLTYELPNGVVDGPADANIVHDPRSASDRFQFLMEWIQSWDCHPAFVKHEATPPMLDEIVGEMESLATPAEVSDLRRVCFDFYENDYSNLWHFSTDRKNVYPPLPEEGPPPESGGTTAIEFCRALKNTWPEWHTESIVVEYTEGRNSSVSTSKEALDRPPYRAAALWRATEAAITAGHPSATVKYQICNQARSDCHDSQSPYDIPEFDFDEFLASWKTRFASPH